MNIDEMMIEAHQELNEIVFFFQCEEDFEDTIEGAERPLTF